MLLDVLMEAAARRPHETAIAAPDVTLDFGQLAEALRKRAPHFIAQAGRPVVIREADPAAAMIDILAARLAGAAPLALAPGEAEPALTVPDGAAFLRSTGGTSGAPRFIASSESQVLAAALIHARLARLFNGAAMLTTVPPWTSFGLNAWLGALVSGAAVHYLPPAALREVLARLGDARVVVGCGTPPLVKALARLRGDDRCGRAPLITAAAPYPTAAALVVAERHGLEVIDRYGATEAGPIAQARVPGGPLWTAPEVSVVLDGSPPTLRVRSPAVAMGILDGPSWSGTFQTADQAIVAADGSFQLLGRIDRIIKRMGRMVDLGGLEGVLAAQPGVAHARVRVRPSALDVDLVAEVMPVSDGALEATVLSARLAELLAPWQRPTHIAIVAPGGDVTKWRASEAHD